MLQVVIFDLWALRLSNLKEKIEDASDTDTQSQMYSSQSEGESDTENENRQGRRGRKTDATPSLLDALALCYLGMITLRLPMTLGDLYQAATKGDIVYLRAIKQIPVPMKERLPAQYHAALDPRSLLKPDRLQNAVINLDIAYSRDFGVVFPSLNHPLLLLRYMKELALPLEIYPAVRRLAHLVSYTFSYPTNMERQLRVTDFPENQFASLVIVATKLFYPFDDLKRYPHTPTEPAAAQMDWKAWIRLTKEAQAKEKLPGKLSYEDAMKTKESDVFAMDDMDMDQYLDWYQRTWADEDVRDQDKDAEFRRAMSSMFPIDSGAQQASVPATDDAQQSKMEKVKAVQGALKPRRVITEEEAEEYQREINRPGSKYKQYRHESDLPEHAKAFYEAVAKLTGVSLNTLVQAVFLTERKLQKWVDAERRKEYGEVEDEYES